MANGFHGVWAGVDDGEHGRDYPEEDPGNHTGDGGDVELVDKELPLSVENALRAQHLLWEVSVSQSEVEVCFIEKEAEIDCSIGPLLVLCCPLTLRPHPVVGVEGGRQQADGQAATKKREEYESPSLEIVHFGSVDDVELGYSSASVQLLKLHD